MYKVLGADGQQYGPVTADQVRRWLAEGRLGAKSLVQMEGAPEWKALEAWSEFAADFNAPPRVTAAVAPPLPATAVETRASSRIAAGICGILLGGLGVHKFILGYTGAGLIMLLVTLLTCFVAYPLMHLIGLIEGIIYLSRSDSEFVRLYVDSRREWF